MKKIILVLVVSLVTSGVADAAQQAINQITTPTTSREALRNAVNTENAKAQSNFVELYAATPNDIAYGSAWNANLRAASMNAVYDKIEALILGSGNMVFPGATGIATFNGTTWGDSLSVVTTVGETGADTNVATEQAVREAITTAVGTGPVLTTDPAGLINQTTGVFDLTGFQVKTGASYPATASTSTVSGNINIDGAATDHYYFSNGANAATYTPVITAPPATGYERGIILTVGGGAGVVTMTWTNVSFIGTAGAATTTANKYSHYACFIPSSGNARCKIIAEASDN